jgi:hypothetical protein
MLFRCMLCPTPLPFHFCVTMLIHINVPWHCLFFMLRRLLVVAVQLHCFFGCVSMVCTVYRAMPFVCEPVAMIVATKRDDALHFAYLPWLLFENHRYFAKIVGTLRCPLFLVIHCKAVRTCPNTAECFGSKHFSRSPNTAHGKTLRHITIMIFRALV